MRLSAEIVDLTSVETVEAFVQRVLPEAYRLAATMVCDPVRSEEVAHDAVLAAWDRRDRLRDPDALDVWLTRFVADRCRGLLRIRSRHGTPELGAASNRGRPDAPVPANLPARMIAALVAREERGEGRQRLWRRLSEVVSGALFVLAVGAVALVMLPWSRPSTSGPGEPTAPITAPSPSGISEGPGPLCVVPGVPSGSSQIVVVRLPADLSEATVHDSVSVIIQSPIEDGAISMLQVTGSGLCIGE